MSSGGATPVRRRAVGCSAPRGACPCPGRARGGPMRAARWLERLAQRCLGVAPAHPLHDFFDPGHHAEARSGEQKAGAQGEVEECVPAGAGQLSGGRGGLLSAGGRRGGGRRVRAGGRLGLAARRRWLLREGGRGERQRQRHGQRDDGHRDDDRDRGSAAHGEGGGTAHERGFAPGWRAPPGCKRSCALRTGTRTHRAGSARTRARRSSR